MILKVQFTDSKDRQEKINSNRDKILIEEQNISDGNFLIFSDVKPFEEQVLHLQRDNVVLMDALATTFEEILNLQEQVANLRGGTV